MCKTYDAIYELSKHTESDILLCFLRNKRIEGQLHMCDSKFHENRCYEGVITLKDAVVTCRNEDYLREYKWINIPSKYIETFAFKCCEKI